MVRDCKIASIYEGSNGIQAKEFLGRKIAGSKGAQLGALVDEIKTIIDRAKEQEALAGLALSLEETLVLFETVAKETAGAIFSPHAASAFACAHPLMEAAGDIIMAWMLLWRASIAVNKDNKKDAAFFEGKIRTARYFIGSIIPVTKGKLAAIETQNHPAADMDTPLF